MAVLRSIAAVIAIVGTTACYSPQLTECAVSCAAQADCGPGQICGEDRFCASPELAGHCGQVQQPQVDASVGADAAMHFDAPPPPPIDAQALVPLTVRITGRGAVVATAIGTCDDSAPQHECTFLVPSGAQRTLQAIPGPQQLFFRWDSTECAGQGATCVVTPTAATLVSARFKQDQNHQD